MEWSRVIVPNGGRVLPAEASTEGYRDEVEALTQRHEVAKRLGVPMAQSTVTAPRRQRQDCEALAKKSRRTIDICGTQVPNGASNYVSRIGTAAHTTSPNRAVNRAELASSRVSCKNVATVCPQAM